MLNFLLVLSRISDKTWELGGVEVVLKSGLQLSNDFDRPV